ncbi:mitochondrial import inner membrane translocase subunit TIM17 [Ceratobasidium sp. AG-Ba]|nr:mitochondrial import inner membrane translocase subunit TIM17 [Ceratobasidium sp. AG-Ba]
MPGRSNTLETDHSRDPCPYVILNDTGGAFAMGAIGGAIWHGVKGARNSPKGHRIEGMMTGMKARAPVVAGNIAAWGGLLSAFNCVAVHSRQKEDGWNAIFAGALSGGCLSIRSGPRGAIGAAIAGGTIMGVFEGVSVALNRIFSDVNRPVAPPLPPPPSSIS